MAARERQSNFELLRLLAMFLIVVQHYASGFTDWKWDRASPTHSMANEVFIQWLSTSGKIGVDLFLMLTGYFLNGRPIKTSSLFRTWAQVVMWSWIIFACALAVGHVEPRLYRPLLFPVTGHGYWFISSYVAVMCCTGLIAALAKHTTPAQLVCGLGTLFVLMSVLDWNTEMRYCNTQWFIFGISVGATIRRLQAKLDQIRTRTLVVALAVLCVFNCSTVTYFTYHSESAWVQRYNGPTMFMRNNWSIETLCFAVVLFLLATRVRVKSSLINTAAACTLGVYLIHENQLVSPHWHELVRGDEFKDRRLLPVIVVLHITAIYTALSLLEYGRSIVLGRVEEYVASRLGTAVDAVGDYLNAKIEDNTEEIAMA